MTQAICLRLLEKNHEWHDSPREMCKERYEAHKHRRHLERVLDHCSLNGFERLYVSIRIGGEEFITSALAIIFVARLRSSHQGGMSSHRRSLLHHDSWISSDPTGKHSPAFPMQ